MLSSGWRESISNFAIYLDVPILADCHTKFDAWRVGSREATERFGFNPGWTWAINLPLPIPTWCSGQAPTLDDAKAAFREAWERFYTALTPHDIEHWHHHQDAAAARGRA